MGFEAQTKISYVESISIIIRKEFKCYLVPKNYQTGLAILHNTVTKVIIFTNINLISIPAVKKVR